MVFRLQVGVGERHNLVYMLVLADSLVVMEDHAHILTDVVEGDQVHIQEHSLDDNEAYVDARTGHHAVQVGNHAVQVGNHAVHVGNHAVQVGNHAVGNLEALVCNHLVDADHIGHSGIQVQI